MLSCFYLLLDLCWWKLVAISSSQWTRSGSVLNRSSILHTKTHLTVETQIFLILNKINCMFFPWENKLNKQTHLRFEPVTVLLTCCLTIRQLFPHFHQFLADISSLSKQLALTTSWFTQSVLQVLNYGAISHFKRLFPTCIIHQLMTVFFLSSTRLLSTRINHKNLNPQNSIPFLGRQVMLHVFEMHCVVFLQVISHHVLWKDDKS